MATGQDTSYQPASANYREQGGNRWVVANELDVVSGGHIDIESGGYIAAPVTSPTTAQTMTAYGHSTIAATSGGGAQVFNIAAPIAGASKTITCSVANSSDTCTVFASTAVTIGPTGSANRVRFVAPGTIQLIGVTTARYDLCSVSTLIAFVTS